MKWKNKKVLVTGSEGMIGKELVILLKELGCYILPSDCKKGHIHDLRYFNNALNLVQDGGIFGETPDYVFHLAGIKGNPRMTKQKPVDFMAPMLQFDTNMIVAAQQNGVKKFLYTSSIAVENTQTDFFPAWAKLTAENLIDAMKIQHPKGTQYCIVRPANVYGKFDNPNAKEPMVITSLIKKAMTEDKLEVWGDGSQLRDFISAKDVAKGMIRAMELMPEKPVNLCSGKGVSIKEVAETIGEYFNKEVVYDISKPKGDDSRVMLKNFELSELTPIQKGLKEVMDYATNNWNTSI